MGASTATISRDMFSESLRYQGNVVESGIAWVDADANDARDQVWTHLRRVLSNVVGDGSPDNGYLVVGTGANNDFTVSGGGASNTDYDLAGRIYVKGWVPFLLANVAYVNTGATEDQASLHRRSTGLSATILTDTSANYETNELAGRQIVPDITDGTAFTIASNTATTITISSGDMTAVAEAGDRYRVNLSTPGGARTDKVWLDVWKDEIDGDEDASLIHTIGTSVKTHQLRERLEANIRVVQDWSTNQFTASASDTTFTYTDTDGREHQMVLLATLARTATAAIASGIVTDERETFSSLSGVSQSFGWLNLATFGGDLQAAVDALPSTGGTIVVPPGTWAQASEVLIQKDSVVIIGSSPETSQLSFGATHGIRIAAASAADPTRRCVLMNLWINGDSTTSGVYGIYLQGDTTQGSTDHCVMNCRVTNFAEAVRINIAWTNEFIGCILDDAHDGPTVHLVSQANANTFHGCRIGTSSEWCVQVDAANQVNFIGCDIEGGTDGGIWLKSGSGCLIQGCYMESNGNTGATIEVGDSVGVTGYNGVVIQGCYLNGFDGAGNIPSVIQLTQGQAAVVTGNHIRNSSSHGVSVSSNAGDPMLLANHFDSIGGSDVSSSAATGMRYQTTSPRTLAVVDLIPIGGAATGSLGNNGNPFRYHNTREIIVHANGSNPNTAGRASPQTTCSILAGYGAPSGVTANWGSMYIDLDGGATTTWYRNESATGQGTTWTAIN